MMCANCALRGSALPAELMEDRPIQAPAHVPTVFLLLEMMSPLVLQLSLSLSLL